jgi:dienelactone hydrolase
MKTTGVALVLLLGLGSPMPSQTKTEPPRPVRFAAGDGLEITADLYDTGDKKKPVLVLCHQARSSRGEYRAIAPRLRAAGFNCLALDQRSGAGLKDVSRGVKNETAARAKKAGKKTAYPDARADIEAAIAWLRKEGYRGKLTLWGSSYSASLALMIGAVSKEVAAVVAFSPGEYLPPEGSVGKAASGLEQPVLIVAPERERAQAEALFHRIPAKAKTIFVDPRNRHGSSTLFLVEEPEPAWKAVLEFLGKHGR